MVYLTLLAILGMFALYAWQTRQVIIELRAQNKDLLDRWYISKGLPVQGVDVKKVYEDKQEQLEEKKRNSLPRADVLMKGRFALIKEEQERLGVG